MIPQSRSRSLAIPGLDSARGNSACYGVRNRTGTSFRPCLGMSVRPLTANLPTGSVVFSGDGQRLSAPVLLKPVAELSPDALLRELSTRWGTGLAISAP